MNKEYAYNYIYNHLEENIINNKYINKEIIDRLIDKKYLNNENNIKRINNYLDNIVYIINKDLKEKYINSKYDNITNNFNNIKNYFNQIDIDFADYNKKRKFINYAINYYKETKDSQLRELLIQYLNEEENIKKRNDKEQKLLEDYKEDARKTEEKELSPENIKKYFNCLKEAIYSYDEKNLGKEYKFHSEDFNGSIHEGLSLDFSVSKKELPHLLGLKNPNYDDKDSFMLKLYNNYLNANNLSNTDDNYLKYISLHFEEDIIETLKTNNKEIKELILKSYNKCINFIQVYEYKKIPEIILDYNVIESHEGKFKDNSRNIESKATQYSQTNTDDHSKDLVTRANKDYHLDIKNILTIEELDYNNLSEEEKKFIKKLKNKFSDTDKIYIFTDKKNNKLDTSIIKYNDIIYEYKNNIFWSQLEPNIYIASYNKKELIRNEKAIVNYQNKTILALCSTLKNDLNLNNGTIKVNTIEDLYNSLKTQMSENKLNKLLSNIYDEKRNHLVNTKTIEQIIKLLDNYDISAIANEYNKTLYNDADYKQLSCYIKDNFDNKPASRISRLFGFANNTKENNKLIEEPPSIRLIHKLELKLIENEKDNEHIINEDVQIIGYSTIRKENEKVLADIMKEKDKKKIPQKYQHLLYLTKGEFKEKYAKTLMGKTFLQLLYDLRINGWYYELDAISYKDKYFNCKLLIEDSEVLENIKLIKNSPEYDDPKHTK